MLWTIATVMYSIVGGLTLENSLPNKAVGAGKGGLVGTD
jgi:hypothetical protein